MSVKFQYIVIDNYSIHEWKMFMRLVYIMAMQLLIRTILMDLFFYYTVIPIIVTFFPL